ncbi:SH3 domain and tetratricopeptide repeat-containing protein 2 isoform X6 [Paroedura picta]|uniref:SH3 domain and tetratricopeptide repeat-containing protein 2 isoform X6 n=1 Tax=Paroedura picta TaxID=143630 RepID=UPI00405698AE
MVIWRATVWPPLPYSKKECISCLVLITRWEQDALKLWNIAISFCAFISFRSTYSPGKEPSPCSSIQPMFLASWSSLYQYTSEPPEKCFQKEKMASEISLSFSVKSRSGQGLNHQLQEAARKKLWALENDDKDVCALFKELSARLVCIQAQEDRFLLSFKTIEEIWKFSTYLALGYVSCCLEHLLFTPTYWLNCALVEDTKITVTIDEDHMATMFLGLLFQEGNFFAKAVLDVLTEDKEEDLKLYKNELVHMKDIGHEEKWEGTSLSTDQRGLVPVSAIEPLPHPFYQWFLKNYPISCGISNQINISNSMQIGQGKCRAKVDHRGRGWDELSFCKGDIIEIQGFLFPGLQWFIGKSTTSGMTGFVQTNCVHPETNEQIRKSPVFFSEQEVASLFQVPSNGSEAHYTSLLSELAQTDVASVYRLDGFEPVAVFSQTPSDAIMQGLKDGWTLEGWGMQATNSLPTPIDSEMSTPDGESSSSPMESLLLPEPDDLDDPKFFIDLNAGHMEDSDVFDPILTFLNQDGYVAHFQGLYDISFSFLTSTFYGFSNEEELVLYLEASRNWAKKGHLGWAHIRICFILGRLCVKRGKFSQARVYFEEAMSTMDKGFEDLPLLTSLYTNLAAIYLKQKMKEKFLSVIGKVAALVAGLPGHCFSSENELEVMMYILREAIAVANTALEVRASFLVVRLFLQLGKYDEVLPFAEHLQFLCDTFSSQGSRAFSLGTMPVLSYLYDKKYLPHIALASARLYSPSDITVAPSPIWRAGFVLTNASKLLKVQERSCNVPAVACYDLICALAFLHEKRAVSSERAVCAILSKMYLKNGQLHAVESLCHFHSKVHPDIGACIVYHEHQVFLAQQLQDKEMEGQLLQVLGQLYQSLHTTRSLERALDCTKQSLRIFIDLGETVKTAQTWLQAGRLYYQNQEDELVEMYLQAAVQTALKAGELHLAMNLYEEAGDVFFNGNQNRQRAVEYYRGGAVPLARKLKAMQMELRVFHKLTELQIGLQNYEKALEFATLAARLSVDVGDQLQELVAFHRLATVYYFLHMYEMAEDCYLKTLSLCSPSLQGAQEAMYYSKVYCRLGDLTLHKLKDEHDAANYFLLALAAATELGDQAWQGRIQEKLAQIDNASQWNKDPRGWTTYRARWLSEGRHAV